MTEITITDKALTIEVKGWDKLWSLKSRLEIPLEHVTAVRSAKDESSSGIRAPGTHIPGVITAGTFHQHGDRVFWDVHNPSKAIAIDLRDDRYAKLIVEVADPASSISMIEQALAPANA